MRAIVPPHVDVAIIRAADVACEMESKIVELTSAVLAMRRGRELESRTSSIDAGDHVDQLRLVVTVPASSGRQEAHHTYRVVVNLIILRRNLPWSLFRHGQISGKRIKAPPRIRVATVYQSAALRTLSLPRYTGRTENHLNSLGRGGHPLLRKKGKHGPMHVLSCYSGIIQITFRQGPSCHCRRSELLPINGSHKIE